MLKIVQTTVMTDHKLPMSGFISYKLEGTYLPSTERYFCWKL